jgi:serine/threonine-protein kinase
MATAPAIPPGLPQTGEILDGKYQIEDVLGSGGMGIVVAARHLMLGQRVAIKFILHAAARDPDAWERLLREARAVSAIRSEHVARVHDVGRLPSGAPYMVMEHLVGTDLSRLRRARGRLPLSDAVDAVLQAGEAIAEAHAMGIIHRDLKPSNLFVIARPDRSLAVKVLDFGLSKMDAPQSQKGRLTKTGLVAGSPQYMAPEQMRSLKYVDQRADVWSLGVILYYLMTGRRPYEGKSIPAMWAAITAGAPASLRAHRPEVPEALDALVLRCVERDPARRVQNMVELAHGLAPFASARGVLSVDWITHASAGQPPSSG